MPTNLPPEYFEAEKRFREAESPNEKVIRLEEMLGTIPKHKGTDKLRADLRRKLSKLKSAAQARKGVSQRASAFHIEKEGVGQAVVIGLTNVGKSSLVAALTNAEPEAADVPFTTWSPTPGMMEIENVQVQLIDTPSLDRDYVEPELRDLIRRADLIFVVVDLSTDPLQQLQDTLGFLREHQILPPAQKGAPHEDSTPLIVLANKNDDSSSDENFEIFSRLMDESWPVLPVSAVTGRNFDELRQMVFDSLDVIRVYSKAPGKEPDLNSPFVMKKGGTIEEFARKIHLDFYKNLKSARVWGSAEFEGQMVGRDFILEDGDVVELRI